MSNFLNLTPEKSKNLDNAIFENALSLKADALLLVDENKSFSSASSLLILSLEETIKAILVLLHSEGYSIYKLPDARTFFRSHVIRHGVAKLLEMGLGLFEVNETWKKQKKNPLIKKNQGWLAKTLNNGNVLFSAAIPFVETLSRIEKLQEFNDLKNNGLYVDYRAKLTIPKESINEDKFQEVKEIIERIFKFYKDLKEVFERIPKNEVEKKELEGVKKELRLFIDVALEGFSFIDLNKK